MSKGKKARSKNRSKKSKKSLVGLAVCPVCGNELGVDVDKIWQPLLICSDCVEKQHIRQELEEVFQRLRRIKFTTEKVRFQRAILCTIEHLQERILASQKLIAQGYRIDECRGEVRGLETAIHQISQIIPQELREDVDWNPRPTKGGRGE